MNEEMISFRELLSVIKRKKMFIFSLAVISAIFSFLISAYIISPTFEASTQVLVAPKQSLNNLVDAGQIQSSVTLVNTYRVIIQSPAILDQVQDNVIGSPEKIGELISVNSEQNSQVININVRYTNPIIATEIANEISRVFSREVPELMSVDNVKILSQATIPILPVKPNIILNTVIAAILGILLGIVIVLLKNILDRRIKTENDVEVLLDLPLLGSIPIINKSDMSQKR